MPGVKSGGAPFGGKSGTGFVTLGGGGFCGLPVAKAVRVSANNNNKVQDAILFIFGRSFLYV
jgi:hypothetical protein